MKRKNQKWAWTEKAKVGHRLDGIFWTYHDNIEYEVIEVKSLFVQINSTEWFKDGFKLGKTMHDVYLAHLVKLDKDNYRLLDFNIQVSWNLHLQEVIGELNWGNKKFFCRSQITNKSIVSSKRICINSQKRRTLWNSDKLKKLIKFLADVWRAKVWILLVCFL